MTDWLQAALDPTLAGTARVLVTVASVKGSAPREPGAKMLVTPDAIFGTIGGGHLELKAIEIARKQLGGQPCEPLQRFALGASLGQCCGGVANLLFEPVSADAAWLKFAARCSELGTPCVRVVPVRGEGALIVAADASAGTLGAAALDAGAIERARALLAGGGAAHLADVADGATARTCLIDPLRAEGPRVWLFGAGHVGRALVNVLAPAAGSITWIDERDDEFPRQLPSNVRKIVTDTPVAEVAAAPVASFFLVMTHNHALDEELAEAILKRGDFAYFGLIGSATKRRRFEQRLSARGMDAARLAAMTCPIGAAGIGDKRPAAIAIAAAAELLHRYESRRQDSAQPQQARSA